MHIAQQVNVLDEVHNPKLREAIKTYSQWPTIPQVYFVQPRCCVSVEGGHSRLLPCWSCAEQYNRYALTDECLLQLYIAGELVGGADIVEEMHTKGELKELLSQ